MIEKSGLRQYSIGSTFATVLLLLCSFMPGSAQAQRTCDEAQQRIFLITETGGAHVPDSLQTLLDLAAFFRECKDEVTLELELWILNNEVFALDKLRRYEEASGKVDRFFDAYFEAANDLYRGRFYLWRLRFDAFSGDVLGIIVAYNEAKRYADVLDTRRRAHLHLDGAYAYREINEFETALKLVDKAKALIGEPATYKDSLVSARAMHDGAETLMRLGTRLQDVKKTLMGAIALYGALGDTAIAAVVTTLLGETYAADGDTSIAFLRMSEGVQLARRSGSERSVVYTLYRQGQLMRISGDFEAAKQSLSQGLDGSEPVREFYVRILYELARLYEQQHDYKKAAGFYQAVINAPHPSRAAEELAAALGAREGRIRILLIEHERSRMFFWLTIVGLLLLLGLVGAGFYQYVRRRADLYDKLKASVVLPEELHTGLTLKELEQRFQKITDSELLGSRLARLFAVLFEPALVLDYIDDEYLKPQVEAGKLENNTGLFQCEAAVEVAVDKDREFRGNAANTLRSYLYSEFRRRSWEWPKNPPAWRRHFLEHHVKRLL